MLWKSQLCSIWSNSLICLLVGGTQMVDMSVKTVKKVHTLALIFHCTVLYSITGNAFRWH